MALDKEMHRRTAKNGDISDNLIDAARFNQWEQFQEFLPTANVNKKNTTGNTALAWAARNGNLEMVEALLAMPGIKANTVNARGRTPLTEALCNRTHVFSEWNTTPRRVYTIVQKLANLPSGNSKIKGRHIDEALFLAVANSDDWGVENLLDIIGINVSVNLTDNQGNTPLINAVLTLNKLLNSDRPGLAKLDTIKALLSIPDIKLDVENAEGDTALSLAKRFSAIYDHPWISFPNIVEMLEQHQPRTPEEFNYYEYDYGFEDNPFTKIVEGPDLKSEETSLDFREVTLEDLNLSNRTYSLLKRRYIDTLEELCEFTEHDLMSMRNFGQKSLDEVKAKLDEYRAGLRKNPDEKYELDQNFSLDEINRATTPKLSPN